MISAQSVFIGFISSLFVYFSKKVMHYLGLSEKGVYDFNVVWFIAIGTGLGIGYVSLYRFILLDPYIFGMLYSIALWGFIMLILFPVSGREVFGGSKESGFASLALHTIYGFLLGLLFSL